MMGWMVSFGYQYVFLNEQGDIPPDEFDKNYFYKMFGILMAIQVVTQFGRGFIAYNFALEVSGKLNSLGKINIFKNFIYFNLIKMIQFFAIYLENFRFT